MASITLQQPTTSATPAPGNVQAFMRAFIDFEARDDGDDCTDSADFQFALYAFEGAKERAVVGTCRDHHSAALAALAAFHKLQIIIDGAFVIGGGDIGEDERAELLSAQEALRMLWRYHDRAGGEAVRRYAQYVGAAERCDIVGWQQAGA